MAPGSRALSRNWSTGLSLSPPAAAAAGTVRFSKSLSYAPNLNVPSISSTANAGVQRKGGAKSFPGKGSASTSAPITGSNLIAKRNPLEKATRHPGTGLSIKSLHGPTTSSAATTIPKSNSSDEQAQRSIKSCKQNDATLNNLFFCQSHR